MLALGRFLQFSAARMLNATLKQTFLFATMSSPTKKLKTDIKKVTLCGGGNGAHVVAALFTKNPEFEITVYSSLNDEAQKFKDGMSKGGVVAKFEGKEIVGGKFKATKDANEAFKDADIVILMVPAFAHEAMFKTMAPLVKEDVMIVGLPSPCGFNWLAQHTFKDAGKKVPLLVQSTAFPWACRIIEYGRSVDLLGVKSLGKCAASPQSETARACEILTRLHHTKEMEVNTKYVDAGHILTTSMWCTNAIIHPGTSYGLLHDWDGKPFKEKPLFYQGLSPEGGNVLRDLSEDIKTMRDKLQEEFKIDLSKWQTIGEYMTEAYGHDIEDKSTVQTMFNTNSAFRGLTIPCVTLEDGTFMPDFKMRYYSEDLPHGIGVLRGIGELLGVKTPTIDKVLTWAQKVNGSEYLVDGKIQGKDVAHSSCPQRWKMTKEDLIK